MNRFRAPVDPHLDPLRAPSARGQHPHIHRLKDENHNPQNMYEQREGGTANYRPMPANPRAVGASPPTPPPSLLDNPLVILGLGALAVLALAKLTEKREEPRRNPGDTPAPPQSVVVVSPPGIPIQTAAMSPLPALPVSSKPTPTPVLVPAPKPKREISEERRKQLRKTAKEQPRYRTGEKKGQFKPRRTKR